MQLYPSDWRVRLVAAAGCAAGMTLAMLVGALFDLGGFPAGYIAVGVGTAAGVILGQLAGERLFRPSSGGPPSQPPHA
jgi:hypothetical protein